MGGEPTFLLGARSKKELLLIDEYEKIGRVFITTEDGSEGEKGFVTNHSILSKESFDMISTCGPKPMMMAVANAKSPAKSTFFMCFYLFLINDMTRICRCGLL